MISYWFVSMVSATYSCLPNCTRFRSPSDNQVLVCVSFQQYIVVCLIAHVLGLLMMISYWFVSMVSETYSCLSNCTRFRSPTDDQLLVCFYGFSNI